MVKEQVCGVWGSRRWGRSVVRAGTLALMGLCVGACTTDDDGGNDGGDEVTCGGGTIEVDGECRPDAAVCGPDAELVAGVCKILMRPAPCGLGTEERDGICVPIDDHYQLRVVTGAISADGFSKVPVFAIGSLADGSISTKPIVLRVSRPGAGTLASSELTLGPLGASTFFTPCNAYTSATCAGPARLTLALASAPDEVLASVDITLKVPDGVGSMEPCLLGGNVMFFDGNDYIYNGVLTVRDAGWSASGSAHTASVSVDPSDPGQGLWWDLTFSSQRLGTSLSRGVYENAQRAPFASPGHPGLNVSGDGRGCNTLTGRFQVHDYELQNGVAQRIAVSFEQHCEGGASVLRGCIFYQR